VERPSTAEVFEYPGTGFEVDAGMLTGNRRVRQDHCVVVPATDGDDVAFGKDVGALHCGDL
jgi:hypothetical protein